MKIGVSYNLWKGEELLKYSIKSIREHVDYIVVVYQNLSNFKQDREDLLPFLEGLLFEELIDDVIFYEPDFENVENKFWGIHNELIKRNLGLKKCLTEGCTHLIDLDTDEIYDTEQFIKAKEMVMQMGYDGSFCQNITYYKFPNCVIEPAETKYTPFIYKINSNSKFEPIDNDSFPVLTDGKRRVKSPYVYVFPRSELELHHFSYVRNNDTELKLKFENCSSKMNFTKERTKEILSVYNNFEIGEEVIFGLDETYKTKEVENKFNITL